MIAAVVTTIQEATACCRALASRLGDEGARLVVVGDRKGPMRYDLPGVTFLSIGDQAKLGFSLAAVLPEGHYARKNLGYLWALREGAILLYETDDDNRPLAGWRVRSREVRARRWEGGAGWANVYRAFTEERVWPRGLPLDEVDPSMRRPAPLASAAGSFDAPIQQGLADGEPDVDAVWRLILPRDLRFTGTDSVWLPPGTWCPFNSQSTWWWPEAFVLAYLPTHCTFRMTDIWRSFVAQRCLWATKRGLVFHPSEVEQLRNAHDPIADFRGEVPGYLANRRIAACLADVALREDPSATAENLLRCYRALVGAEFLDAAELPLVERWVSDVEGARA
jgi:hypothetical protein